MEPKKTIFTERPALIEPEGSVARINFDIEESTEVVNQGEGQEAETRTVFLAHIVRVEQPLTVDRIKVALLEAGFDEYKAEEQAALTLLSEVQNGTPVGDEVALARRIALARINAYDQSNEVNGFTIGQVKTWLPAEKRAQLKQRFLTEQAHNVETSNLVIEELGVAVPLAPEAGLQMLDTLEFYAIQCYDRTAAHKAAVAQLTDVSAILNYDYRAGYPEQPVFGE